MKKRWMVMAMAAIPVVFFVLLEIGLRVAGFGNAYPLFVPAPRAEDFLLPNPDVAERWFARTRSVPGPPHDAFRAEKRDETLRIFVQGESTAAGFPYRHGATFSRILLQRIGQAFPSRDVEVVNTAVDAVSSAVLVDQVAEIVAQKPDAVLVYAGHNEFYGIFGVASSVSFGGLDVLRRVYFALDGLRTVQLVRAAWARLAGPVDARNGTQDPTLMEELGRDRLVPPGSRVRTQAADRFREHLSAVLCAYQEAGIPVFVGTLFSNERDVAPLASVLAEGTDSTAWAAARAEVAAVAQSGDLAAALPVVNRWVAVDTSSAIARFERATLLHRLGRADEARAEYRAAIELDALPFRAPASMNAAIRDVAARCGAHVVETESALRSIAPGGTLGSELLLEHVHPNVDGQFIMADAFFRALAETGLLGTPERRIPLIAARREVLLTELDSTTASLHVRRILNSWPFRPTTVEDTFRVAGAVDALAVEVMAGRLGWDVAMGRLGQLYEERGDLSRALQVALALVQEYPYRGAPMLMAGHVLSRQGRLPEALRFFLAAGAREPSVDALRLTGQTLTRMNRAQEALQPLEEARTLAPDDPDVLYDLGVAYVRLGRRSDAMRAAQQILQARPAHPGALRLYEAASADSTAQGLGAVSEATTRTAS